MLHKYTRREREGREEGKAEHRILFGDASICGRRCGSTEEHLFIILSTFCGLL
jgi:hypothetical protein